MPRPPLILNPPGPSLPTSPDLSVVTPFTDGMDVASESFRTFADAVPQMIWTADTTGKLDFFNRRSLLYTCQTTEQATGDGWGDAIHPADLARTFARWQHSVTSGEPYEMEYRLRQGGDGTFRWFLGRAVPLRDEAGQVVRWFGTCTDIHDQKMAELSLQRAKDQSEQNGRAKDEFLSVLSHELRTPLSAILGWTQLLEMGVLDEPETKEAVQIIKQQAKVQSQLIEDLLEVSRMISGKFHMRQQVVQLSRVLQAAFEAATPLAVSSGVNLTHEPWDETLIVRGDPQRLQQLIWNLLVNAIKFTNKNGTIDVSLARVEHAAEIVVRDDGMGIPVEQIDAIFDRFTQANAGVTRARGGLGLGLSIVKHIVQLHAGTIKAASAGSGQGSVFTVALPALVSAEQPVEVPALVDLTPDEQALYGLTLLVVDDEDSARTVVASALRKFGANVLAASSADDAWAILTTKPLDLLVSDIAMPYQSGLDLIKRIRESTLPFKAVPAIALTAFASFDDQTRALDAGFQVHVAKPIEPLELVRRVLGAVRDPRTKA